MQEQDAWRVLYVEDDDVLRDQVKRFLDSQAGSDQKSFSVELVTSFDDALENVERRRCDLLILDVFAGKPVLGNDRAGADILAHLKRVRFTPTIFYTALPSAVQELESPFVKVIGKEGTNIRELLNAANAFIDSGLLALNRGLSQHVETILLDYMEGFVAKHWSSFATLPDKRALAYLVARRLAMSLSSTHIDELARALGDVTFKNNNDNARGESELAQRMQYYIIPPVSKDFLAGDIIEGEFGGKRGYWVVLTPSCDMVTGRNVQKAEYVLLVLCSPLNSFPEYEAWRSQPNNNSKRKDLDALLRNNRYTRQSDRYHYLPGVFDLPHLIVDFQQVHNILFGELQILKQSRIASLDSPYAEAIVSRYNRYSGRVGVPDLDIEEVLLHLQSLSETETGNDRK